mmetsp:Transcript_7715/g.10068  ORF Transcript_7715/g.10068 Transcript_7715/m.10068 type:complete len:263 (-) Transcript_7715:1305-2093(-)
MYYFSFFYCKRRKYPLAKNEKLCVQIDCEKEKYCIRENPGEKKVKKGITLQACPKCAKTLQMLNNGCPVSHPVFVGPGHCKEAGCQDLPATCVRSAGSIFSFANFVHDPSILLEGCDSCTKEQELVFFGNQDYSDLCPPEYPIMQDSGRCVKDCSKTDEMQFCQLTSSIQSFIRGGSTSLLNRCPTCLHYLNHNADGCPLGYPIRIGENECQKDCTNYKIGDDDDCAIRRESRIASHYDFPYFPRIRLWECPVCVAYENRAP